MSAGNDEKHNSLHPFIKNLGDKIAEEAPSKYLVSPQAAYREAGQLHGELHRCGGKCRGCSEDAVAYSQAGVSEVRISGMCEPCFDFVMQHPDDRTEDEQRWMSLVKYNKKGG